MTQDELDRLNAMIREDLKNAPPLLRQIEWISLEEFKRLYPSAED